VADESGTVVSQAPPTPIAIALGAQIVRLFSIPLERLTAGRYELTITTTDQDSGVNLEAREAFVVDAPAPAPGGATSQ
jgi:hypothetical protein